MSEPTFDIAFYGILQPGNDKEKVMANMAKLFKTTPEKIKPFFAGGRKVIKSNVDELTAKKYRGALEKIGLVIKLEEIDNLGITMAEAGADVLENPPEVVPQQIDDISDITMAEVGVDVLENPPEVVAQQIDDISDITMAEAGADVLENPPVVKPPQIDDISDITIAEVGADVIENPKPKEKAPVPDTSGLSVEDDN